MFLLMRWVEIWPDATNQIAFSRLRLLEYQVIKPPTIVVRITEDILNRSVSEVGLYSISGRKPVLSQRTLY